jgi:hypothetical protein
LQGIGRHLVESAGLNGSFEFLINHSGSPCLEQARRGGCGGLCWNRDIWMGRICFGIQGRGMSTMRRLGRSACRWGCGFWFRGM